MKIRNGFVSNSSSSSFAIWGVELESSEVVKMLLKKELITQDTADSVTEDGDWLTNYWEPKNIEMYEDGENQTIYFGRSWNTIKDDQTGKEFKTSVQEELKEVFGKKMKCESIETEICSG